MSENDFQMELEYPVSPDRIYEQLTTPEGIGNWWTKFCHMKQGEGGWATFRFEKRGFYALVNIQKLEQNRLVEWEVFESKHSDSTGFKNLRDWIGTKIRFEIEPKGNDASRLILTHGGLRGLESFEISQKNWSFYLDQSLRQYLTTGTGQPHTDDGWA